LSGLSHRANTEGKTAFAGLGIRTALVGTTEVRYQVHGQGEPLVLLHGLAGSTAWWRRNVGVLSRHYTVYLMDWPGFGAMRQYRRHFSVAGAAGWLGDLLGVLGLSKVSLVGHSMGGLIAAIFAARWPDRLAKLVLVAPAIGLPRRAMAAFLLPLAREAFPVHPRFAATLARDTARAGLFTLQRAARELLHMNIERELAQITTPCLLVWGQRDLLVPAALGHQLQAKIQGSRLCLLPRAGHIVMYHRAEQFNQAVLTFLAEPRAEAMTHS
jgi:pimeloyl-ACP methyl ester carboxylesterase